MITKHRVDEMTQQLLDSSPYFDFIPPEHDRSRHREELGNLLQFIDAIGNRPDRTVKT